MQFSGVESQNSAFYHDLDYQDTNYLHILSSNLTMHVKTILNEDDTYPSFVTVFKRLQSTKFYLIFQYNIFDMIDGHIIRFFNLFFNAFVRLGKHIQNKLMACLESVHLLQSERNE